jgi:TonB family protein
MGVVYQARDPFIGRLVAIKTITSGLADDAENLQRFQREAQAAGSLQHPNIVTIFEMGSEEGMPYMAMEYLDGEGLDRLIARQTPVPFLERLSYLMQLCRALQHAHEHGVVHRDVKPANVVVKKEGTIKVVDFGIARLADTTRTQTGVMMGTVAYMSPQQLHGNRADERSDIWATGVLAYELLSGRKPFRGDNHGALILDILSRTPEPLAELVRDCPADILVVLARAMNKEEGQRYQSMSTMLAELEPLWKREQSTQVEKLLDHTQKLLEKQDYSGARKELEQVLRIDRANGTAAVLLEELRCAREGMVLQEEIQSMVERAHKRLEFGLFSDARAEANAILQLDSNSKIARELLKEAERMESAAHQSVQNVPDRVPALQREYVFQGPQDSGATKRSGRTIPFAEVLPATATATAGARRGTQTGSLKRDSTGTMVGSPAPSSSSGKALTLWIALFAAAAVLSVTFYFKPWQEPRQVETVQPAAGATNNVPPTTGSLEDRQRTLMEQAHEAADQADYATARTRLDEAEKLGGPLGVRISDLRKRFSEEEQNAGVRVIVKKESELWNKGTQAFQQNQFDEAESVFRIITQLPDGGRRREDAAGYLSQVIPQRREEEKLFAQAQSLDSRNDAASLQQNGAILERIISMKGPRRSAAEHMRAKMNEKLAALTPKKNTETNASTIAAVSQPPSAPANPAPAPREASKIPDAAPAKAADAERFESAVKQFEKVSHEKDVHALKESVLPEFQQIAQLGGSKAGEAQRYVAALIPAAIRDALPWPAIGCPPAPAGLSITIKSGDIVACGMLDAPRLKWGQFVWPAFPDAARQAGQQKGLAMLSLTVDENGNIVGVKPRGKSDTFGYTDAALSAARQWKTTPPRAQGKPVKTEFAVDVPFTP